jgi:hypothetical protein
VRIGKRLDWTVDESGGTNAGAKTDTWSTTQWHRQSLLIHQTADMQSALALPNPPINNLSSDAATDSCRSALTAMNNCEYQSRTNEQIGAKE